MVNNLTLISANPVHCCW